MYFCGAKVEARPKSPLFFQVSRSHTSGSTHPLGRAWTSDQPVTEASTYTTNTRDDHSCLQQDSNLRSQQSNNFIPRSHDHPDIYSMKDLQEGWLRVKEKMSVLSCPRARRVKRNVQEDGGLLCGKAAVFRNTINGTFCFRIQWYLS